MLFAVYYLSPRASPVPIPTLQDAIASGIAVAEFSGNGGSSGDSVVARVAKGSKAGPGPAEATLPAGSVLVSGDAGAQNMMVAGVRGVYLGGGAYRPESRIDLTDGAGAPYLLRAYCITFEKENPSNVTRFALQRPDPALACIAQRGQSLTDPAMQAAVWMQTDNVTQFQMSQKFPIAAQDWEAGQAVYLECRNKAGTNPAAAPQAPMVPLTMVRRAPR
jgi:hypothetical protein